MSRFLSTPRAFVAVACAVVGAAVAGVGLWFAAVIGPSGELAFDVRTTKPLVLTPDVLNRVDVPVVVTVEGSGSSALFVGRAPAADVAAVVGSAERDEAVAATFPGETVTTKTVGTGRLDDPRDLDMWWEVADHGKTARLELSQADAPESVLVLPATGEQVRATVTMTRGAWFVQAVTVLAVGLVIVAFALGWLVRLSRGSRS